MCIYRNNLRCNVYFVIRSSLVNAVSSLRLAVLVCCHWCSCSEGEEATEAAAVCVAFKCVGCRLLVFAVAVVVAVGR